jgi:orotidine-5'-phosphate decarboxylase
MEKKGRDYIIFPLDFASMEDVKKYVKLLKGKVGMFKVGLELFIKQGPSVVQMVKNLSGAKVFLDLKLHDISATVGHAMERVADIGADLVTVHCSSSMQMLKNAVEGGGNKTGVLGVTLLTDNDAGVVKHAGFKTEYITDTRRLVLKRAQMAFDTGCKGIVCSGREVEKIKETFGADFLVVTPGIRPSWTILENDDQKRVTTPSQAVELGSDYIVIGRPIRDADNSAEACDQVIHEIESVL